MTSALSLPPLAIGCWQFGGGEYWGHDLSDEEVARILNTGIAAGINYLDTAEAYAGSEAQLGRIFASGLVDRSKVILASKIPPNHTDDVAARLSASLERLQTTYLDLYYLHWPLPHDPVRPSAEAPPAPGAPSLEDVLRSMRTLQLAGRIRHFGVSNFGPVQLAAAVAACESISTAPAPSIPAAVAAAGPVPDAKDVVAAHAEIPCRIAAHQIGYNLLLRGPEFDVLPMCRRHGIPVVAYSPLLQGLLAGRYRTPEDVPAPRARSRHFAQATHPAARHGEEGHEQETFAALGRLRRIAAAWATGAPSGTEADFAAALSAAEKDDGEAGSPSTAAGEPSDARPTMADLALTWVAAQPGVAAVLVGVTQPEQLEANVAAVRRGVPQSVVDAATRATDPLKVAMGPSVDMWENAARSRSF
eukprot:TRINITY_DN44576_c0_g1_i1.p1 TRINITY_DN44576_c0_g1~~TRINITY_DN44576_c0_g1_i1.p1  ORF type:complete len:417 (-),score=54.39 TRINITY_DN44576_c0_g1_i1:337-1587(-)